jgi:hypothetical protein
MNLLPSLRALSVLFVLSLASSASAQFQTLVRHVPEDVNTLALFNVEAMMASPLAQKEQWSEGYQKMYNSGLIMVPPKANQVVIASQMDVELMEPHWHAMVMNVSYEPSMIEVTSRYGGNVDKVDGQEAAVLPNDTYVIKFGKYIVGSMFPADRQKATRWVEHAFSSDNRQPLGEYLTEAEGFANKNGTPIILAVDLEHVLSPLRIRHGLDSAEFLKGKTVDLDQVAKVLSSVRGLTLGVTITDRVVGGLKIDFDDDVSSIKEYAKPLVLAVLSNHGAMIQEFNDWNVLVNGKEILLRGALNKSGLQRICTLLDAPADLRPAAPSSSGGDAQSNESLVAQTTLQYFKMLEQMLGDIQHDKETTQTSTAGLEAMWYKRYAAKIDALPVLNVDPAMIQFGTQLSASLRNAQGAMQGVGVSRASQFANMQGAQDYDTQEASVSGAGVGPYGGWAAGSAYAYRSVYNPWASLRSDGQEIAQIDMSAKIKGYGQANQVMENVTVAMANMRKQMTEKYQIEF